MNTYDILLVVTVLLGIPAIFSMLSYNARCAEAEEIREARAEFRDALPWASKTKLILNADYQPIIVKRKARKR